MLPAHLRMARAAVRLGVREVADMAGVAPFTVSRFENEQGGLRHDTAQKLEAVFVRLGVRFTTDAEGRACICFRPPDDARQAEAGRERRGGSEQ